MRTVRHSGRENPSRPVRFGALAAVLVLAVTAAPASAQRDKAPPKKPTDETWREDPYTENDAAALEAAGYVGYHPFPWTDRMTTARVEQALGDVEIRWVETAHFRIGSALPKWKIPGHQRDVRKRLREELGRLQAKIPSIKKNAKVLDPWLRTHLYAQRLEDLYADFLELIGATEDTFPKRDGRLGADSMGRGPYLGMSSKFNVLLFEKQGDCARYLTTFTGADGKYPSRWYFAAPRDGFVHCTATDFGDEIFKDDSALYAHVAFNLVHAMLEGYRGYTYETPVWWREGYAHAVRRGISEEHNMFTQIADNSERIYRWTNWEYRANGYIKHDLTTPLAELATKFDCKGMKFSHHLEMWSRVEFMLDEDREAFGKFVTDMKGCYTAQGAAAPSEYVLRVQRESIERHFGLTLDRFDEAWKAWAKKEYRGKK